MSSVGGRSGGSKSFVALLVAGGVIVCTLLGLSIGAVVQQSHLSSRLAALRDETTQLKTKQQESLDKVGVSLKQLADSEEKIQTTLQAVAASESQLTAKIGALETARSADSTQWKEQLAGIDKLTRDGLAGIATRLDNDESLAASVRSLLQADTESRVQTPSAAP